MTVFTLKRVVHCSALCRGRRARGIVTLGIRREDPTRTWERRCPLSPDAVAELVDAGVRVQVQDCSRRIWTSDEFRKAGASIVDDLSDADVVVGIKEVPLSELQSVSRYQTHFMFSHTHKGQPHNMQLLSQFLHGGRLVDYELLTDCPAPDGKRTISFGWFAGAVGLVEGLCTYARHLLSIGIASPFLHLPRPFMNASMSTLKASLRTLGQEIITKATPTEAGPVVIAVTGRGRVATGALDMLDILPSTRVRPEDLLRLLCDEGVLTSTGGWKIYVVHVPSESYLEPMNGGAYNRQDYYQSPSLYRSRFHETVAPFTSLIVNGAGWQPGFPRIMDSTQLIQALERSSLFGPGRLCAVADVTCDLHGGMEFVTKSTTIDEPFFTFRPSLLPPSHPGLQVMSIDILPAELPLNSSCHFSDCLQPYLLSYLGRLKDISVAGDGIPLLEAIDRATIVDHGQLTSDHQWLYAKLEAPVRESFPVVRDSVTDPGIKNVLLLGSGMVAQPVVDTISGREDVRLIIGTNNLSEAQRLLKNDKAPTVKHLNATRAAELAPVVEEADLVISLLPASLHASVAELCIRGGTHMVHASYISSDMRALDDRAHSASVTLLGECGLDPGIDHCIALDLIRRMQNRGKQVKSFVSFCGGLPAPEFSNVPLAYKFSWAPKAVLAATKNNAVFKLQDECIHVPGPDLLRSYFRDVPIIPGFAFEGVANRNSLSYLNPYGLGRVEDMTSVLRGTLRYRGFVKLMDSLTRLGLLNDSLHALQLKAWPSLTELSVGQVVHSALSDQQSVLSAIRQILGTDAQETIEHMKWLGLLACPESDGVLLPPLPSQPMQKLDLLSLLLSSRLRYLPGERDMVALYHSVASSEGEEYVSQLVVYGDSRSSAMARTVGLPVAFAALRVLDGSIDARGVIGPTHPSVYPGLLRDLFEAGLAFTTIERVGARHRIDVELARAWHAPQLDH